MVLARTRYRISFPGAASVPAPPGSLWGALSVTTPATAQQCNAACAACLRTVALLFSAPSSARPVAGLGLSVLTNRALRRLSPVGTGTRLFLGKPQTLHPDSGWLSVRAWIPTARAPLKAERRGDKATSQAQAALKLNVVRKKPEKTTAEAWPCRTPRPRQGRAHGTRPAWPARFVGF